MMKTAKTSTKFALSQTTFNNVPWVILDPAKTSSLLSSGSPTKNDTVSATFAQKPNSVGQMFEQDVSPLKRLRSTKPSKRLLKMRSKAYRAGMAEANAGNRIAFQIRLLREAAGMSQTDLAEKLGTRQSAVARLEDPNYGKQSLSALHKIAAIFDVATWVEFVPFSTLVQRTADLSPAALTPASYPKEFDEDGQPNTSVSLAFDGSAICATNFVRTAGSAASLFIQSPQVTHTKTFSLDIERIS
ncbi:multiprotein-bridging factor 1 family protein [Paraburkholderia sp. DGU8]|uniref:helix-turn-helix domain-containing protein n=1 Tax=Paraburkholderia sp. DGU8 TaxID=3161997 RepID=UPI0034673206